LGTLLTIAVATFTFWATGHLRRRSVQVAHASLT
jgi:hypothetical protein